MSKIEKIITTRIKDLNECLKILAQDKNFYEKVLNISELASSAIRMGNKIILFGNGGSASDAQHIAAEFVGRFGRERRAYPALALTVNTSVLTALANDYDFSRVFSRQIEAFGVEGDIAIGLSTSGDSENVIQGINAAGTRGMITVGITGQGESKLKYAAGICLCLPSGTTPRIQEMTILTGHIICELVELAVNND